MQDLILTPLAAALIILAMNAYFGLHIIRRGVIFVDLAFAQIAALGATAGMLIGTERGSAASVFWAFGFTLLGALLFSFTRMERSRVPQEAIIGISYVVASAAVILLSSFTAEGAEHIKETLTGSLIWVTWPTVGKVALPYALIALFHYVFRRQMHAITFQPESARNIRLWDFIFYVTFGVAVSLVVDLAGVLLIFSTLVIPATIAFLYVDSFKPALFIAWATGTLAIVGGLLSSFHWDVTTGPLLVVSFGVLLVLAWALRALIGARSGGVGGPDAVAVQETAPMERV